MPSIRKLNDSANPSILLMMLALGLLISGCASHPRQVGTKIVNSDLPTPITAPPVSVLRYGRYTLVEVASAPDQRDLMQQVVDITMPMTTSATVGDAIRYLLMRTGYLLCEPQPGFPSLDAWPLPAAHIHLGPLTLRDA